MSGLLIGYARVSTNAQDLTAQRDAPLARGIAAERIYVDHGFNGVNGARPGLREALAACKRPKLTARQDAHLLALHAAGEHATGELAELFGVGRSTVYRSLEHAQHTEPVAIA